MTTPNKPLLARVLERLCIAFALVAGISGTPAFAADARFDQGLLWRIERPGVAPSFLFGTIHVSDVRALATAKRVANRFTDVGTVATEVTFERTDLRRMAGGLNLPSDRTLAEFMSAQQLSTLKTLLAPNGFSSAAVDRMTPFGALAILTAQPRRDTPSIDVELFNIAKQRSLKTIGLESVDEQLASIGRIDQHAVLAELIEALNAPERFRSQVDGLVDLYLNEAIGKLVMHPAGTTADDVVTVLIDDRNVRMRARAVALADVGGAFIAVGASHLAGAGGLLVGFETAGFSVTRVRLD